jgi:tetratricopeptide (TPR) repeat protein
MIAFAAVQTHLPRRAKLIFCGMTSLKTATLIAALLACVLGSHVLAQDNISDARKELIAGREKLINAFEAKESGDEQAASKLFAEALARFQHAQVLNPRDFDPVFFEGVTRTVMEDFCTGLRKLKQAVTMGCDNPDLLFYLGTALSGAGNTDEGLAALVRFVNEFEQNGKGSLGNVEEARKIIAAAELAKQKIGMPSPPCGKPSQKGKDPLAVSSQLSASINSGVGYDNNVTKLGKGFALPSTVDGKDAAFFENGFALGGDWFFPRKFSEESILFDKLSLNYALTSDFYDRHSDLDQLLQQWAASYGRVINSQICVSLTGTDVWIRVDDKNFANSIIGRSSLKYTPTDRLTTQLSYSLNWTDFFAATTPGGNPDAFTHRIEISQAVGLFSGHDKSPILTITGVYGHEWTISKGLVADRQRDDPLIKLDWSVFKARDNCSFLRSVSLAGSYQYRSDRYENATFPTLTAAQRFWREDEAHLVAVVLSAKMWYDKRTKNRLEANLELRPVEQHSNVLAKTYDQTRLLFSVKANF